MHDDVKVPIIKTAAPAKRGKHLAKASANRAPKKFSLTEFLDQYLQEDDKTAQMLAEDQ